MSSEIFEKLLDTAGNFRTAVDLLLLGNSLGLFREREYNDILTNWLDECKRNLNTITNLLLCTPKGFDFIKSNHSLYIFFNEECKFFDISSIGRICASSIEDYLHIIEVLYGAEWFLFCQFTTLTHQEYAEGIHQYIDSQNKESDISIFNKKFLLLHIFATSVDFNKNHQIVKDFLDEVSSIQYVNPVRYVKIYDPRFFDLFGHNRNLFIPYIGCNDIKLSDVKLKREIIYSSIDLVSLPVNCGLPANYDLQTQIHLESKNIDNYEEIVGLWSSIKQESLILPYEHQFDNLIFQKIVIQYIRGQESLINFIFECFKYETLNINNIVWLVIKKPNTMKTISKKLEEMEFFHTEIYRSQINFYINLLYFLLYIE